MWLAETAVDDDTLRVLEENGIKFTILSPFQAKRVRQECAGEWQDVSWGNIDPARSYRYYINNIFFLFTNYFFWNRIEMVNHFNSYYGKRSKFTEESILSTL